MIYDVVYDCLVIWFPDELITKFSSMFEFLSFFMTAAFFVFALVVPLMFVLKKLFRVVYRG